MGYNVAHHWKKITYTATSYVDNIFCINSTTGIILFYSTQYLRQISHT